MKTFLKYLTLGALMSLPFVAFASNPCSAPACCNPYCCNDVTHGQCYNSCEVDCADQGTAVVAKCKEWCDNNRP